MARIAKNYNDFVEKLGNAELNALNSELGQQITAELLKLKLAENPDMDADEWEDTKAQFMVFVFYQLLQEHPDLMHELCEHLWYELRDEQEPSHSDTMLS